MSINELAKLFEENRNTASYELEEALINFTEKICQIMEEKNISRADLARMLGKSRAWVTKVLRGNENLTMKTMVEVLFALGHKTDIQIIPLFVNVTNEYKDYKSYGLQSIMKIPHFTIPVDNSTNYIIEDRKIDKGYPYGIAA